MRGSTLVAGPVVDTAARVDLVVEGGCRVRVELVDVAGHLVFVARISGAVAVEQITARDARGKVVDMTARALPAPTPPSEFPPPRPPP